MSLNRTSLWKVMTIWISRELPLFNYERLVLLCDWIRPPCDLLWPFEYLESFRWSISSLSICDVLESDIWGKSFDHLNFFRASGFQFRASRCIMRLNRTYVWNVLSIWISRELPLFNFEHLDMWCAWIGHPSEKLLPFGYLESFHCSILSVSICDAPEFDIWVNSYDHLHFIRASVVQFRASWYVMRLNWTSEWKVMTIWISRELPLFNFECLDIWCVWIGHPSEKLWQF